MSFVTAHQAQLDDFSRMSGQVGARTDYVQGGGGNTSVKLSSGEMCIKASGYRLSDITPSHAYAVLNLDMIRDFYLSSDAADFEDVEKAGSAVVKRAAVAVEGLDALRPSVEAGFHALLKRYVIHSHSIYANLAACAAECEAICEAALGAMPVPYAVVDYCNPGARLTFSIRAAIEARNPQVIIMRNHGLIATADCAEECLALHEQANACLQTYFGVTAQDFPVPAITQVGDGEFESATKSLIARLKSGQFPSSLFLEKPLYPDQLVFLKGTLIDADEPLRDGACRINPTSGIVSYKMPLAQAQVIEETLCALVFIMDTLKDKGYTLTAMNEAARSFIQNWESEKYRKALTQVQ
ncbi:MAG: class II aldolase/adducin family protein [Clostridia bacterium]